MPPRNSPQSLIPRFRRLHVTTPQNNSSHLRRQRCRRRPDSPMPRRAVSLPTWNQIRRLSAEASRLIREQGQSRTPSNFFLAMLAILSCQTITPVQAQAQPLPDSQVLWAYVPNPPVLRPVTWNDPSFSVYLNDTSVFGLPSSTHIIPQSAPYSYVAQAASPPMCFHAPAYSDTTFPDLPRFSPLPVTPFKTSPYCFHLDFKQLTTYEGPSDLLPGENDFSRNWFLFYYAIKKSWNLTSPHFPDKDRPRCYPTNHSFDSFPPWRTCYTVHQAVRYTLSSGFTLYDWSVPFPRNNFAPHYHVPGGWSTPLVSTPSGRLFPSLWRLFPALVPAYYKVGSRSPTYVPSSSPYHRHYVKACVAAPYALLYGSINITFTSGQYFISCSSCTLTNCLDSSVFPTPTILVVHQPPYVMLPVNISGPWYEEHSLQILHQMRDLLLRPKRFIGLLVTGILAIVSIVATAATAAAGLAHSVQTATYVNHLAQNISVSMGTQMDIDKKLEVKLNALEQTVTLLGDKVYNIQSRLLLRCHVDFKYICVTNTPYNDTQWQWPLVKAHLQGIWSHNNLSLDIVKLQQQIHAIDFSRQVLPRDDTVARDIVNTLFSWTRGFHLPSFSSIIAVGGCVLLLLIFLPFLFRLVFSSIQKLQFKLFELNLKK
ncbi:endogenous retrovirus group K member 9 Env polyprotein-like [Aotus nancymaae]|uniref:endogenous retrovirus group K member 9 Env polyprotein-like n=1 Tax=Aotus nancymaae TaxID=37293 RepID=UPI0030FEE4E7